jgi:hypothetical protein
MRNLSRTDAHRIREVREHRLGCPANVGDGRIHGINGRTIEEPCRSLDGKRCTSANSTDRQTHIVECRVRTDGTLERQATVSISVAAAGRSVVRGFLAHDERVGAARQVEILLQSRQRTNTASVALVGDQREVAHVARVDRRVDRQPEGSSRLSF